MRDFEVYLSEHLRRYPSMQVQDVCKLCYQAAYGARHLLRDPEKAYLSLRREFDATPPDATLALSEPICAQYSRINIAAWKAAGRTAEQLFDLICSEAKTTDIEQYLCIARRVWKQSGRDIEEFDRFVLQYQKDLYPVLHHSEQYRQDAYPAYRIVAKNQKI